MATPISQRYSQELEPLDQTKLSRNPSATGRLSPIGFGITILEVSHFGALFIALPALLFQRAYCGDVSDQSSCPSADGAFLCQPSTMAPSWLLHWLILEAIFCFLMKVKLSILQSVDPQEAFYKAAKIMSLEERQVIWDRVMKAEAHDVAGYFEAWFFDTPFEEISRHELQNHITWGYFDSRKVEHLSVEELQQLDSFTDEVLEKAHQQRQSAKSLDRTETAITWSMSSDTSSETESESTEEDVSQVDSWLRSCGVGESDTLDGLPPKMEQHQQLLRDTLEQAHDMSETELALKLYSISNSHKELRNSGAIESRIPDRGARRFGRPTADPLLGVRIFPLVLHLLMFLTTELPCGFLLWILGFRKYKEGSIQYYYRPGRKTCNDKIPLVFIHGIGLGPIIYLPLIVGMMTTGRPLFVPEVLSVSAFRPWILPHEMKTPEDVATSLSLMVASHGFAKATFSAHSYGTFWMTYMVKYAPNVVASLVFCDPVNFCLYNSSLTRRIVYNLPDPGDIGYMIKTDMMVNWSMQRNFSWVRGNLFVEDIGNNTPYAVFLSGDDKTAPSKVQAEYLKSHTDCQINNVDRASCKHFECGNSVTVFPGCDHGLWMLNPLQSIPKIVQSMDLLTEQVEKQDM